MKIIFTLYQYNFILQYDCETMQVLKQMFNHNHLLKLPHKMLRFTEMTKCLLGGVEFGPVVWCNTLDGVCCKFDFIRVKIEFYHSFKRIDVLLSMGHCNQVRD